MTEILLRGVKQNNLKDINVDIPLGSFTVVCGPSGSGKSSLAFETLFAEGQRRYIESLSNYARQFLGKAPKPLVDLVENIPPAIAIEQKNKVKNSRSTVGTTTEVTDYLRLLFAKIGQPHCPDHGIELRKASAPEAAAEVVHFFEGQRGYILSPLQPPPAKKADRGTWAKQLQAQGFLRVYHINGQAKSTPSTDNETHSSIVQLKNNGSVVSLNSPDFLNSRAQKGQWWLVIDRVAFRASDSERLTESLSQAYNQAHLQNQDTIAVFTTNGEGLYFSQVAQCPVCQYQVPPLLPQTFSFNSPLGACENCKGFGNTLAVDEDKVIPNPELTLAQGALVPFAMPSAHRQRRALLKFCQKEKIDTHIPWQDLSKKERQLVWRGKGKFKGVLGHFERLEEKKYKMHVRVFLSRFKSPVTCSVCSGDRLKPWTQTVTLGGWSLQELCGTSFRDLQEKLENLHLSPSQASIAKEALQQVQARLRYLNNVGLNYLTAHRETRTLSGGEYQRIQLAHQLGMELSQTLFVLDEPTVGLHPRDNDRLIEILKNLQALGNTLVVVEHDRAVIECSERVIELGPRSGIHGGEITYQGPLQGLYHCQNSSTAPYLGESGLGQQRKRLPVQIRNHKAIITITGCRGNNLRNIELTIPLNRFVAVSGVSGSGKSSLIGQTLYPALARALQQEYLPALTYDHLEGANQLKSVLFIDQKPVTRSVRSHPASYLKIFDAIRQTMAASSTAKQLGLTPGTFSLNVEGGRCPDCQGLGYTTVDMVFMDDITLPCETCEGRKYQDFVLDVTYQGKNIAQILEMTANEAIHFFASQPKIRKTLSLLREVGLDYIKLGQDTTTLSGGESQRLKIVKELMTQRHGQTLYILDEPTTGLHFQEIERLIQVLDRLVHAGASVLVIEHNMDVLNQADFVIDIGPEAGAQGGQLVASGTPLEIAKAKHSHTGRFLRELQVKTKKHYKPSSSQQVNPRETLS